MCQRVMLFYIWVQLQNHWFKWRLISEMLGKGLSVILNLKYLLICKPETSPGRFQYIFMGMVRKFSLHKFSYKYPLFHILVKQLLLVTFREESGLDSWADGLHRWFDLVWLYLLKAEMCVEKHLQMNWRWYCYLFSVLYESVTIYCCSLNCANLLKVNGKVRKY